MKTNALTFALIALSPLAALAADVAAAPDTISPGKSSTTTTKVEPAAPAKGASDAPASTDKNPGKTSTTTDAPSAAKATEPAKEAPKK